MKKLIGIAVVLSFIFGFSVSETEACGLLKKLRNRRASACAPVPGKIVVEFVVDEVTDVEKTAIAVDAVEEEIDEEVLDEETVAEEVEAEAEPEIQIEIDE